jgi:anaerobic selenocysteine-containing dehydrogenase/Fe-S-cluster-containing dehydrogenase component
MSEGIKRRDFLKVVGVGGAGAGLVGCSTEKVERLLPFVVPPEDVTPGVATWYTTVCQECPAGCGMWVRTREGRVVKVEGNPRHPISAGALCARGHASVQGLYSADRYGGPMIRENGALRETTWEEAETLLAERIQGAAGNVLLMTGTLGPSMSDLVDRFLSAVGGDRVEHEGLSEAPLREATRIAFGRDAVPRYDLESARFILSFGADFLETWVSPVEYSRAFARSAGVADGAAKAPFVFVGPRLSLTGQNADEWIPIQAGSEAAVALGMASVLAARGADAGPYSSMVAAYDAETAAAQAGISAETIVDLATRFAAAGPGVALGPGVGGQHRNATASNLAIHILNAVAGNVGRTVHLATTAGTASAPYGEMESAIRAMAGGRVGVALVLGTNPTHSLPPASGFADAFASVPFKVSFASEPDETSALADLVLPDRTFLEAWGDSNARPGMFSLQQPVMRPVPLFDSKQAGDVLLSVASRTGSALGAATFYDHLRARWQQVADQAGGTDDFEAWWKVALKNGVVTAGTPAASESSPLRAPDRALTFDAPSLDGDGDFALLLVPSARFSDGKQANRPWMQELPDPVSKLVWHSWVELHPRTAEGLGVDDGDIVRVTSPHGELEVPVWTYPGIREDAVAISMGSGRTTGRWAADNGVNPLALLPAVAEQPSGALVHLATRVSVSPTGEKMRLATIAGADTQHDRGIAPAVALADLGRSAEGEDAHETLQELQLAGGFVPIETEGKPQDYPLPGTDYGEYTDPDTPRWAMAIDLDKCTGCSSCVVACQSENNVPWVGESEVRMGRDLHWIRIERYYEVVDASHAGPVDVRHLPMLCQHCNNAPCEPVCPVFATYHTPEGLNAQIYNRCIGIRYCANNCPYKVRVFNWYSYSDVPEPMHWAFNPDVTVRENGVMEKCSFCVQRIRSAQNRAALEDRAVREGEVVPACQQSCPAEAIVFGNIRDPESRIAQKVQDERSYRVFDELLNTQPAVTYQKKVTFHEVASAEH